MGPEVDSIERPAPLILTEGYDVDREMPNGYVIKESVRQTNLEDSIYDTMTDCKRTFSAGDIEAINDGLRNLANALEQAGYEEGGVKLGQIVPSFQFGSSKDGELPLTRFCMNAGEILYGLKIAGVPGAYIGQPEHRGASFNREMTRYFEEAIQRACKDIRQPQTGEMLTDEWLDAMAQRTIDELRPIMSKNGRTIHHALIDSDTTASLVELASNV